MKPTLLALVFLCGCCAGAQTKPHVKSSACKEGAKDAFAYVGAQPTFSDGNTTITEPYFEPRVCLNGKWVLDKEEQAQREAVRVAEVAKRDAEKKSRFALWDALRTRVLSDAEMERVLELGISIIPPKDGGIWGVGPFGTCELSSCTVPSSDDMRAAETILNNALFNQFKMRLIAKDKP